MDPNEAPWWKRGAIYQIYPRSFADSGGDGVGDLPGIRKRLPYLRELGAGALWLSPFYRSPMADFGYDVSDYCDVDPVFGTLADFDGLTEAAHETGIRMVVDWVPNHTSDQHQWFTDPAKRDWYVWRDEPPNHWRTQFTRDEPAWTRNPASGEWYLHSFLPQQPDLDWDNPEVERAMHDVLRFWLGRGVDGFRIDVVYRLAKDPQLGENEPGRRHDQDWPTIGPRLQGIRRVLEEFGAERMAVGEVYLPSQADLVRYVNPGDQLHMVHNFHFFQTPWSAAAFHAVIGEFMELLAPEAWPAWCLNNHDHPRLATRHGAHAVRAAAVLLITLRGTPFLYQGEELGLADVPIPPERVVDVDGRDPERAPIPWEPGPGAGFTTGEPWLPITPDAERVNARAQASDPRSVLSLYRALLALRRAEPELQLGAMELLDDAGEDVLAYTRGERHLVAINFADAARMAALGSGEATCVLSSELDREERVTLDEVSLRPGEALVLRYGAVATKQNCTTEHE